MSLFDKLPKPPRPPRLSKLLHDANPVKDVIDDGRDFIQGIEREINSLANALNLDQPVARPAATPPPASTSKPAPESAPLELPTEAETVVELKRRLGKEIAKAEIDLTNKLKIPSKDGKMLACSCLDQKHNLVIEGAAEELIPKEPKNTVYQEVIDWFKANQPIMTARASASGQYDEKYLAMAGELGEFRRRITRDITGGPSEPVKGVREFLKEQQGR